MLHYTALPPQIFHYTRKLQQFLQQYKIHSKHATNSRYARILRIISWILQHLCPLYKASPHYTREHHKITKEHIFLQFFYNFHPLSPLYKGNHPPLAIIQGNEGRYTNSTKSTQFSTQIALYK